MKTAVLFLINLAFAVGAVAQPVWQANLDGKLRFYQTTDFGLVLAATEKSLYAIDGSTGERVWRRSTGKINATAITPVPNTDMVLFTIDLGNKSRLEAVDVLTGKRIWQSDKVKGDVMQLALDPESDLLAIVLVKDPRGPAGERFKRKPVIHVLRLSDGDEVWKRDLDSSIEMMPAKFGTDGDIDYTLDNYRAPLLLDGRLYIFYEGSTSYDARTGKEKEREKFNVNEEGLALTEADPVFDETHVYVSGRGQVRAINRQTGHDDWKASDLGNCAEMVLAAQVLYVRTGGQFTRLNDGEIENKGPYGVSAINVTNGKTLWRYKGADKGLTNFAFVDQDTIVVADRDDLITIDARSGKRLAKREHNTDRAAFVVVNESGHAVVGGRNEIAAFRPREEKGPEVWRVRHTAPGRGVLRTVTGIALRAAALYFRYAGPVMSGINIARTGLSLATAANSFRWSGVGTHFDTVDLTTLASNSARNYVTGWIYAYGSLARDPRFAARYSGLQISLPNASDVRSRIINGAFDRATPSQAEIRESIFDRIDPARQLDKLGEFLLRRKRLAELRANYMYFYADLPRPFDKRGLVGVNVHTGQDMRFALVSDPDPGFTIDESLGLLYSADGSKLQAFELVAR